MFDLDTVDFLCGRFAGTDSIEASVWAEAEVAPAQASATRELGGNVIVQRLAEERAASRFEVLHVFMADPQSDDLLLYAFDTFGYPADPPARGVWHGGELVLERATERGMSRTRFAPTQAGFRLAKEFRPDPAADWVPVVSGTLDRADGTAQPGVDQ